MDRHAIMFWCELREGMLFAERWVIFDRLEDPDFDVWAAVDNGLGSLPPQYRDLPLFRYDYDKGGWFRAGPD